MLQSHTVITELSEFQAHKANSMLITSAALESATPHKAERNLRLQGVALINNPDNSAHYYELNQHNCMCHIISRGRGDMRQSQWCLEQEAD